MGPDLDGLGASVGWLDILEKAGWRVVAVAGVATASDEEDWGWLVDFFFFGGRFLRQRREFLIWLNGRSKVLPICVWAADTEPIRGLIPCPEL